MDIQDVHGDTALNLAARIGARHIVEQLLDAGANPEIENRAGLKASSFGFDKISGHSGTKPAFWSSSRMPASANMVASLLNTDDSGLKQKDAPALSARVVFPSIATGGEHSSVSAGHSRQRNIFF